MIYQHFNDIPNRSEMDRIGRLVEAARQKAIDDPAGLTDSDFAALTCMGDRGEADAALQQCASARFEQHKRTVHATRADTQRPHVADGARVFGLSLSAEDVAEVIADAITLATDPLKARIAALEARPVGAKGVSWSGTWRAATKYAEASLVTHAGSLWMLATATPSGDPPGQGADWRLIVKRGSYRNTSSENTE